MFPGGSFSSDMFGQKTTPERWEGNKYLVSRFLLNFVSRNFNQSRMWNKTCQTQQVKTKIGVKRRIQQSSVKTDEISRSVFPLSDIRKTLRDMPSITVYEKLYQLYKVLHNPNCWYTCMFRITKVWNAVARNCLYYLISVVCFSISSASKKCRGDFAAWCDCALWRSSVRKCHCSLERLHVKPLGQLRIIFLCRLCWIEVLKGQ